MDYRLIRSRRRTVSLRITRDGSLVVRAPLKVSQALIDKAVAEKSEWIEKTLKKFKPAPKKLFIDGETFLFLGERYSLQVIDEYRSRLEFRYNAFRLSRFKQNHAKDVFIDWYKKQAEMIIGQRADYFAGLMNVKFRRLLITSANTRWGSCSNYGTINFTWRLVLAPLDIVDSVVVHELAHLIHHNHSKRFWDKVKEHYPNYPQAKKWLKQHSHLLHI
jgi:predicted metal-dependent hydrolase